MDQQELKKINDREEISFLLNEYCRTLDAMDLDKRAIFVMFELEEMRCPEIAAVLGVPVGTVYSRLHAARHQFEAVVAARTAREGST